MEKEMYDLENNKGTKSLSLTGTTSYKNRIIIYKCKKVLRMQEREGNVKQGELIVRWDFPIIIVESYSDTKYKTVL